MELVQGLKQMEGNLAIMSDRIVTVKAKLEDLLFRAQRISAAAKNNMPNNDSMYGYDLQAFRRNLRTFSADISGIPAVLGSIERQAVYDEKAIKFASSVLRVSARMAQNLKALHDMACLAHQHIRTADHKMEAWYISQEIEEIAQKGASLPTSANKIVIAVSTQPKDIKGGVGFMAPIPHGAPAAAPAPAPAAPPAPAAAPAPAPAPTAPPAPKPPTA